MSSKITLRKLLETTDRCFLMPCVYDCASARAMEMCGYEALMLSGGEVSLAMNGAIDYGFTGLTDLEWVVSRVSQTMSIPLCADIEDGFGGPLAVYRAAKRLAKAGAAAIQLEDAGDMENSTELLPRKDYMAKVKAALDALEGTDCLLIARTNADPKTQLQEGCERMAMAEELGAQITTIVKLSNYNDAVVNARYVKGWKMYPDIKCPGGVPEVTAEQLKPLNFRFMTTHFTLKAAMEGMLEHGMANFKTQNNIYGYSHAPATGILGDSATPLWEPESYMRLEGSFTGDSDREYTIVGNSVEPYPQGFKSTDAKDRL